MCYNMSVKVVKSPYTLQATPSRPARLFLFPQRAFFVTKTTALNDFHNII